MDDHRNFAISTVAIAPSPAASGGTMTVAGGSWPTPPFNVCVWAADSQPTQSNAEIVRVTAMAGASITAMSRAQEGTNARTILVGDQIANTVTDKVFTDIETAIAAAALPQALNTTDSPTFRKISMGTPAYGSASRDLFRFTVGEAGFGDFSFGIGTNPTQGNQAGSRGDNVLQWGYNPQSSAHYVSNDDTLAFNIECSYWTGDTRQGEYYCTIRSGDGVLNRRPFGITPQYDLHKVNANFAVDLLDIGVSETVPMFRFYSYAETEDEETTYSGRLMPAGESSIDFQQNTGLNFIINNNEIYLGITDAGDGNLFNAKTSIVLFGGHDPAATTVTLYFGQKINGMGIRSDPALGIQINETDGWFRIARQGAAATFTTLKATALPTSASGLQAGQLWNNGGVVNVV